MRIGWWVVVVMACSSAKREPVPAEPRPIGRVERCADIRATWRGTQEDAYAHWDTLTLESPGVKPWTRNVDDLEVSFDVFSPDCKHVLLLRSRLGPYDIVRLDRLAAYAAGAAPDFELAGTPDPAGITGTGVFRDGGWVSNSEVTYTWGCCDPPITTRFRLP